MHILNQSVTRTASGTAVEFVGKGGEKISVLLTSTNTMPSDVLAIEKAKATMVQVATFGAKSDETEAESLSHHVVIEQQDAGTSRTYSPID
jgi:hypothetical protein